MKRLLIVNLLLVAFGLVVSSSTQDAPLDNVQVAVRLDGINKIEAYTDRKDSRCAIVAIRNRSDTGFDPIGRFCVPRFVGDGEWTRMEKGKWVPL